jgi:hypothetical protein
MLQTATRIFVQYLTALRVCIASHPASKSASISLLLNWKTTGRPYVIANFAIHPLGNIKLSRSPPTSLSPVVWPPPWCGIGSANRVTCSPSTWVLTISPRMRGRRPDTPSRVPIAASDKAKDWVCLNLEVRAITGVCGWPPARSISGHFSRRPPPAGVTEYSSASTAVARGHVLPFKAIDPKSQLRPASPLLQIGSCTTSGSKPHWRVSFSDPEVSHGGGRGRRWKVTSRGRSPSSLSRDSLAAMWASAGNVGRPVS